MLTDRQIEVADHLLAGLDFARIQSRMGISAETLKAYLRDMRQRIGANGHAEMMGRLREMRRNPVDVMLERCRAEPRQWWHTT
jgi:DNA-binding CsgD family transcriptional regulator